MECLAALRPADNRERSQFRKNIGSNFINFFWELTDDPSGAPSGTAVGALMPLFMV